MQFDATTGPASQQKTACAIVPVYVGGPLSPAAQAIDDAADGLISRALRNKDIKGDVGELLLLTHTAGLPCQRVLLVGLGARDKLSGRSFRKATRAALSAVARARHADALFCLGLEAVPDTDAGRRARIALEVWHEVSYRFTAMKSEPGEPRPTLRRLRILASGRDMRQVRKGISHGLAVGRAMALARDLGNLPPNVCTPDYLADRARLIARESPRFRLRALRLAEIRRLRMGAFLAVAEGSSREPRFI
ncbi:MAG: leucyl aminopeptidase, partial [Gammaproteobacteria bacterium]|nr:leucyl aminopeptidase [Gammaproteobacteria bacterium]